MIPRWNLPFVGGSILTKSMGRVWHRCDMWFNIGHFYPRYDPTLGEMQVFWVPFYTGIETEYNLVKKLCFLNFFVQLYPRCRWDRPRTRASAGVLSLSCAPSSVPTPPQPPSNGKKTSMGWELTSLPSWRRGSLGVVSTSPLWPSAHWQEVTPGHTTAPQQMPWEPVQVLQQPWLCKVSP